jgi:hypothetical protein
MHEIQYAAGCPSHRGERSQNFASPAAINWPPGIATLAIGAVIASFPKGIP